MEEEEVSSKTSGMPTVKRQSQGGFKKGSTRKIILVGGQFWQLGHWIDRKDETEKEKLSYSSPTRSRRTKFPALCFFLFLILFYNI